jgi:polyisoprenoid-binding protein YceI
VSRLAIYARRVAIQAGTHRLGPDNATLSVQTGRKGAAAKAGHDLLMHVTAWEATLELADDPEGTSMELSADAASLRVQKGTGGIQALGDEEILRRQDISFRSTAVQGDGNRLSVVGDLTLAGKTGPMEFDLEIGDDGALSATAVVKQTDWGMKPYSALFGALKVHEDVEVVLDGHL